MEAAEPIVGRRRVRQFRTTQEKRFIVEETRKTGVSVATVAQAHGVNANQVFYWRKLYEAGQLESTVAQSTGDLGACCAVVVCQRRRRCGTPSPGCDGGKHCGSHSRE